MKFKLVKTLAKKISINVIDTQEDQELPLGLSLDEMTVNTHVANEAIKKNFAISFQVKSKLNTDETVELFVDFWAFFESDSELDDKFINGHFTQVNAPAIAFPYLRSFVTNILVSAGYPAVYLPTVNFVELGRFQNGSESIKP